MRIKLLIFLIVIFCSCSRNKTRETSDTDSVIKIDLFSEPESTIKNLSEIATNVEYIPLQTTQSSLLASSVSKIVSRDKRIYTQNGGLEGELMCFDINGRFLFKLQNRGRGPEEYAFINDFDVSSDNKTLTILSSLNRKLLVYGISDTSFTFLRSIALKDPTPNRISMVPETDNAFLAIGPWRGTEPALSLLINSFGDTIQYKPNCYKYKMTRTRNYYASNEVIVYSFEDMVCFREEFSDTVFFVNSKDNLFKPRMIFDSHGTLLTPEMRGNPELVNENTSSVYSIFETPRFVFYSYGSRETRNSDPPIENIFFDKKTNKKYKLDVDFIYETILDKPVKIHIYKLKDDLGGGPDFTADLNSWYKYCSGGKQFSFVDAIALKKYVTSGDFKNARVSDLKKAEFKNLLIPLKRLIILYW